MPDELTAPDGTPVDAFARLGGGRSVAAIAGLLAPGSTVLDLGCGPGRLSDPLAAMGFRVVAVDESPEMLARVQLAEPVRGHIEDLDLAERFTAVILPSYFVNTPDRTQRRAFLATCARHVAPAGFVFVQRHDPDYIRRMRPGPRVERNGVRVLLPEFTVDGLRVRGRLVYEVDGHVSSQPWDFEALEEPELDAELEKVGLRRHRTLTELDWVVARPVAAG